MMLTIFTRPLCAMCTVMAQWLQDLKIAYREIDVTAVPEARRILRAMTRGSMSVPTLLLEDGRVLVEPSRKALLEALRQRPD
jgi:glutaredoxin